MFAAEIRQKRVWRMKAFRHWKWHLDEVYVKINGQMHDLWRAVDHEGEVLESFVSKTRDKPAALKVMKKLMKRHGRAKVVTNDGLRSYRAAMNELGNAEKQETGRWANNLCEGIVRLSRVATMRRPWPVSSTSSTRYRAYCAASNLRGVTEELILGRLL